MQYRKDQEQQSQVKECRICKERQGRKKRLKATEKKKKAANNLEVSKEKTAGINVDCFSLACYH